MRPQTHYKKPGRVKTAAFATIRIVVTVLAIALFAMVFYYAATEGWEAIFAWFGGKWFCMFVMIGVFAATAGIWLYRIVTSRSGGDDDE